MTSGEEKDRNRKLLVRREGVDRPGEEYISEVSTPVIIPTKKTQQLLPLTRQDWHKVKDLINSVNPISNVYQSIAFAWAGVFPTASTFLVTLYLSQNVKLWMWILAWILTLISPVLFVAFYALSKKLSRGTANSIEIVKKEMDYMENKFDWPE